MVRVILAPTHPFGQFIKQSNSAVYGCHLGSEIIIELKFYFIAHLKLSFSALNKFNRVGLFFSAAVSFYQGTQCSKGFIF